MSTEIPPISRPDDSFNDDVLAELLSQEGTSKSQKFLVLSVAKISRKQEAMEDRQLWIVDKTKEQNTKLEEIKVQVVATNGRVNRAEADIVELKKNNDAIGEIKEDIKLIVLVKRTLQNKLTWIAISIFGVGVYTILTNPAFAKGLPIIGKLFGGE